ncbi:hypothetical protein ACIOKD_40400 [Streptomyces sp. NPDC087844]|uniref:hypothetical protein n=1 Tax=Streptomyces sp. NPDC087844 TaxID=3365805 RepID=UPI00380643EF
MGDGKHTTEQVGWLATTIKRPFSFTSRTRMPGVSGPLHVCVNGSTITSEPAGKEVVKVTRVKVDVLLPTSRSHCQN